MAEQELLPCPCGAMTLTVMDKMAGAWVECKCGWRGPIRLTKAEAVQAWTSTRANTSDYRRGVEDAAKVVENYYEYMTTTEYNIVARIRELAVLPVPPVPVTADEER